MGLFSSKPPPEFPSRDGITVPPEVAAALPDPGDLLLSLYPLGEGRDIAAAELDRVRFPYGGYDLTSRPNGFDKRGGPLSLLTWITTGDHIGIHVWARDGLDRAYKAPSFVNAIQSLNTERGTPYAAMWAQQVRLSAGARTKPWDSLAHLLNMGYLDWGGKITNGMINDSIRKWKP